MESEPFTIPQAVQAEISCLRQQLQMRDQLVDQLSTELFQMLRAHPPALPSATSTPSAPLSLVANQDAETLRQELQEIEQQIEFYQVQIDKRDAELARLQKSCQALSDRNQMLEHVIQELPDVYRQKFSERLHQVKTKVQSLEQENRRLFSELHSSNHTSPASPSSTKQLPLPSLRSNPLK